MSEITQEAKKKHLLVYIPDTRGVTASRYGKGNLKIGLNVFTYSRLPGLPQYAALGSPDGPRPVGTCPGATEECTAICYAARPVAEQGLVYSMWTVNSRTDEVPPIPEECKILRIHVSGDFNTVDYIQNWIDRLAERPDVTVWCYTRSWRVPGLLSMLQRLHDMPNMQMFASMDNSTEDMPPVGWRVAWIDGDERIEPTKNRTRLILLDRIHTEEEIFFEERRGFVCPEETKHKANCEECRYCFDGKKNDVIFLRH